MKTVVTAMAASLLGLTLSLAMSIPTAYAAKVDCDAVMQELNSGKKPKEVAQDLKISRSAVYRCRKKAKAAAKPSAEAASPAASPAAAPKP